jgi:hypothetical protein
MTTTPSACESSAVVGHDVIFSLTGLERDGGNAVPAHKRLDGGQEPVMHRPEEGWGGIGFPEGSRRK